MISSTTAVVCAEGHSPFAFTRPDDRCKVEVVERAVGQRAGAHLAGGQMDKQVIALLIPIVALLIPVTAIVFYGMQKVARIKLEEARLRVGRGDAATEVIALREEMGELRRELSEVQERLDFTERLLTKARDESH
jgi:hypothetical protein